ncbi:MAG TPA: hypothetical protein VNT26_05230, partial [Candidatus Sulfotelmatobacter sp.]|nr:hypothetical protein [Candidatus Sulfotelmatobacter sp.]
MFRPVAMLRLSALVLERDKRAVLRALGHLGAMQLQRTQPGPESAPLTPLDHTQELAQCEQLLSRLEELRRALAIPDLAQTEPAQLAFEQVEAQLHTLEVKAGELLQHRQALLQQLAELSTLCERASSFCGWEVPLEPPVRHSFLHFVLGYLPAENWDQLQNEIGENVALLPLETRQGRQPLIAVTTHQGQPALQSALQRAGFHPETFPVIEGATVDEFSAQHLQHREAVARELEQVNEQLRKLASETAPWLAKLRPVVRTERCLLEAEQSFP